MDTLTQDNQEPDNSGLILQRRASYATIWQLILAIVGTLIVAVPATYYFITTHLDEKFSERIKPYEQLLYGTQLLEDGMFEEAVAELESGFKNAIERGEEVGQSARLSVYLTSYLGALGWVDKPNQVRSQFEKCRDLFKRHLVTEDSVHLRYQGWYLMRVGELKEAKDYVERSLRQATLDADKSGVAWGHYDLAYIALCNGDSKIAHEQHAYAKKNATRDLNFEYDPESHANLQLAALYPGFGIAMKELKQMFATDWQSYYEEVPVPDSQVQQQDYAQDQKAESVAPTPLPHSKTLAPAVRQKTRR